MIITIQQGFESAYYTQKIQISLKDDIGEIQVNIPNVFSSILSTDKKGIEKILIALLKRSNVTIRDVNPSINAYVSISFPGLSDGGAWFDLATVSTTIHMSISIQSIKAIIQELLKVFPYATRDDTTTAV